MADAVLQADTQTALLATDVWCFTARWELVYIIIRIKQKKHRTAALFFNFFFNFFFLLNQLHILSSWLTGMGQQNFVFIMSASSLSWWVKTRKTHMIHLREYIFVVLF